jgi:hypothetical protein
MQCDKPKAKGWWKPNKCTTHWKKPFKSKDGSLGEQTTTQMRLAPHKISKLPNVNQKAYKK